VLFARLVLIPLLIFRGTLSGVHHADRICDC
jgi:hypothetical protein